MIRDNDENNAAADVTVDANLVVAIPGARRGAARDLPVLLAGFGRARGQRGPTEAVRAPPVVHAPRLQRPQARRGKQTYTCLFIFCVAAAVALMLLSSALSR